MIQVRLQPEIEAKLLSQASTRGLDVNHYLAQVICGIEEDDRGMQKGLADIEAGRVRPADEVFAELFEKYGIQG